MAVPIKLIRKSENQILLLPSAGSISSIKIHISTVKEILIHIGTYSIRYARYNTSIMRIRIFRMILRIGHNLMYTKLPESTR